MISSPFRICLAGCFSAMIFTSLCWTSSASAVGLGELRSATRLGYPLRVEIPIHTGDSQLTAEDLKATLLNEEEAARRGVELLTPRYGFEIKVEEQGKRLMVVITLATAIKEPVLHWLIRLDWPKGSLAREYTLMLDI